MHDKRIQQMLLGLSIAVYVAALVLPPYTTRTDPTTQWGAGLMLLLLGWLGSIAWWANPVLLVSWITLSRTPKNPILSLVLSITALALMLSFLFAGDVIADEGGGRTAVISYGAGYWCWVASAALASIAAFRELLPAPE